MNPTGYTFPTSMGTLYKGAFYPYSIFPPSESIIYNGQQNRCTNPYLDQLPPENIDKYLAVDQLITTNDIQNLALSGELDYPQAILNIDCGPGFSTNALADKAHSSSVILGIDFRNDNVNYANNKYAKRHECLEYKYCASPCELPKEAGCNKWTLVFASGPFSWVPSIQHPAILKAIFACMADNAELFVHIKTNRSDPFEAAVQHVSSLPGWAQNMTHYHPSFGFVTVNNFTEALRLAGFSSISVENREERYIFQTKAAMVQYCLHSLPELSVIPINYRRQFVEEVVDSYCSLVNSAGENIVFVCPTIITRAKSVNSQNLLQNF